MKVKAKRQPVNFGVLGEKTDKKEKKRGSYIGEWTGGIG